MVSTGLTEEKANAGFNPAVQHFQQIFKAAFMEDENDRRYNQDRL